MRKWLSELPGNFDVEVNRNSFDISKTHNASYNFGYVYPMYVREVHPNMTYQVKCSGGFDLRPTIGVCQTHVRCHTAWYYVRSFQIWDHAKAFHRQDKTSKTSIYAHPLINTNDASAFKKGSLLHHMGVPCHTIGVYNNNAVVPVVDSNFSTFRFPGHSYPLFNIPSSPAFSVSSSFSVAFLRRSFDSWFTSDSGDVLCHRPILLPFAYVTLGDLISSYPIYGSSSYPQRIGCIYPVPMTKRVSDYDLSSPWSFSFEHIGQVSSGVFYGILSSQAFRMHFFAYNNEDPSSSHEVLSLDFSSDSSDGSFSQSTPVVSPQVGVEGESFSVYYNTVYLTPLATSVQKIQNVQDRYGSLIVVLSISISSADNRVMIASLFAGNVNRIPPVVDDNPKPAYYNITPGFYGGFKYRSDVLVNTDVDSPFLGLGDNAKEHLQALPVRAYEAICNFRFRNRELDPFRIDGQIAVDKYNTNSGDGLDSTTPLSLFKCQYEDDYFTTCMPSPAGNMFHQPLVGITVAANPDENSAVATYSEGGNTYDVEFKTDGQGKMIGMNYNSEDADKLTILTLKDAIQYGISLQDLQNRRALSKWYEATYRRGRFSHDDFVAAHFGKAPTSDAMHAPEYLGGDVLDLSTMRILNHSQADGGILGASGGLGSFATRHNDPGEIECYCDEEGYLMGVCWFTVRPTYGQAIDKMWYNKLPSDYPTPEFANLGTMPVLNKELAPLQCNWDDATAQGYANGTFGYQRIYGDLIQSWDDIAGDYADELNNLIMYRKFAGVPQLGVDFVTCSPEDLNNVFVLDDDADKIYGQWHFDTKVKVWLQQRPNVQIM